MIPLVPGIRRIAAVCAPLMLGACAQMQPSMAALPWQDQWGDRGRQVLARDHAMCEKLVEQRRQLRAGCLASRGWSL